ncbi:MAG: ATPase V [Bacteroidaceae bacterium]|nr:ATPase V [Bacteroidaceae bacterium]MBQ5705787.1 ATPase V [Bacteroidaceae bacterium]
MISKMNKLTVLVYHKDYEEFLVGLRNAGVVHVAEKNSGSAVTPELQAMLAEYGRCEKLIRRLESVAPNDSVHTGDCANAILVEEKCEELFKRQEKLQQEKLAVEKDIATMQVWGDFDNSVFDKLADAGYAIRFYQVREQAFDPAWSELYNAVVINNVGSKCYFVTVTDKNLEFEIEAETARLSSSSLGKLKAEYEEILANIITVRDMLESCAEEYIPLLRAYGKQIQKNIEFSKVMLDGEKLSDDKLVLLDGWVPEDSVADAKAFLDGSSAFYEMRAAKRGDNVPVKLKNNAFARMYEVLTKMYGMPSGTDFDPTPIVAPFFSLFFAFCMGDAGYGLILILLGFLLKKKMGKEMAGMMNLVITLGIFTTVIGALLGTFFGISLIGSDIPEKLKSFIVAGNVELFGSTYDKQMILALAIGVVHISIAMTVKAINSTVFYGFKESLSAWGWWLVVVGGVVIGTLSFLSLIPAEVSKWAFIAVGGLGAIGIYLLNNLKRNVFANVGAGLWDTYNMAAGLLGDVLSYIRLFALGLAGGMLGQTFNSLAMMVVDGQEGLGAVFGWVGFGLIIIIGHTLNIAMSCLSAFVHPLRLTFVEYFKNAGYEGKGVEYKPFKNKE